MDNKNIIFNQTLEQYNKKYKNRNFRLLKITKKEVEDFDRRNSTKVKNFLLKDRKWWFIDGVYYEIPKAPRYTWFRNLNAGVQTATCVLGAGVVATAAIVPTVLLNRGGNTPDPTPIQEPKIVIEGADYDKSSSLIELNKNSTIALKDKSGQSIAYIEEVKVGGNVINESTEWEYDSESKKLCIFANAMTSKDIVIKAKTEQSGPVELPEYFDIVEIPGTTNCSIKINEDYSLIEKKSPKIITMPSEVIKNNITYTVTEIAGMGFCPTGFAPNLSDRTLILPKTLKKIKSMGIGMSIKLKKIVVNEGLVDIGACSFQCSAEEINVPSTVIPEESRSYVYSGTFLNAVIRNKKCVSTPKTDPYKFGNLLDCANTLYIKEDLIPPADSYIVDKYDQTTSDRPTYTKWTKKAWTCPYCGYDKNPNSATTCSQCGQPRPKALH